MCYNGSSCEPYRIAMIRELPENHLYNDEEDENTGAEGVGRKTQAEPIDGMGMAKRGRSDTPLNDIQNPVLDVSQ